MKNVTIARGTRDRLHLRIFSKSLATRPAQPRHHFTASSRSRRYASTLAARRVPPAPLPA